MALDEILESAETVTLKEHLMNVVKRGFDVVVNRETIGTVEQKWHITGCYEFKLTLNDGTYLGKIVEKVNVKEKLTQPGIKAEIYDGNDNLMYKLDQNLVKEKVRNPLQPRVWGTLQDGNQRPIAKINLHSEESPLHFDFYDAESNKNNIGTIDQRDKRGRHTYAIRGEENWSMVLLTAMLDQLYHHTDGTKW